jgi:hypothetical protein
VKINWNFPQPRSGLAGEWDKFIGPGATSAEVELGLAFSSLWTLVVIGYVMTEGLNWSVWQFIVAGLFAFDLAGGIFVNAMSTAKRWYHREGQGRSQHFGFTAVHVFHIAVVAWLFRGMDWTYFLGMSAYLLAAALLILWTPLYLQRPVAMSLLAISIPLSAIAFPPTHGLEWFIPFLFLKLLVSHLLREEPYRPDSEAP